MSLQPELRPLLESSALGHVVTLEPDGTPQVTCVWLGLEGDDIVFASMGVWRKIANLQRDPRVVVSVEGTEPNDHGLMEYAVIHGTASVVPGGAAPLLKRLAQVYVGPGAAFPPTDDPTLGYVVRITADRIGGVGPWAS